ncbi:two-component regulator propeller domain-containing protein [Mucilaginibacter sp.]|jgi:signal transduction histidine kinase/ligand-binding sensor domain-containing protein/AraC-like DNA-binding protein/FixJ family two-component response regulator|uniref:two-component regulator propeller domain-containing protein n=1 Tax=Mucilaginibacter sp. TaxID=1882438 RepID=UPI002C416642|nr:two-component regulator propeller domain-containing protein [Mucilaginibacter sp.]HTI58274.1 two-component regulator propeller domain-containing protein [Mucilaginibacter sp.]
MHYFVKRVFLTISIINQFHLFPSLKMMCRRLILLFAMVLTASLLKAQGDQFQFSRLDINNGLSHNQVNCIFKDSKGFMWFGTLSGLSRYDGYRFKVFKHSASDSSSLNDDYIINISEGPGGKLWVESRTSYNIYDPLTEKFSHNIGGYLRSISVPDARITAIKKDRQGNYWFLNATMGLFRYNPVTRIVTRLHHSAADTTSIYANTVSDLAQDSKGNIWLSYYSGVLERISGQTYHVDYRSYAAARLPPGLNTSYKIYIDNQDDLWVYAPSYSSGVYYLDNRHTALRHIGRGGGPAHLNTDVISNVIQDDQGRMWIATDHGGINLLNKRDFSIRYLLNREDDPKTLGQNSLVYIYKDDTGIIWIGTYKAGVSYYHPGIIKFAHYTHHLSDPNSLPFSDVNNFAEDKAGNIWIGTNGGGLIYFNRKNGSFKQYLHNPNDPNSLANNVVVYMFIDHAQNLWLGTYFGGLDCYNGKTFRHYKHSDADPGSISENRVCSILEDSEHRLLVGTTAGGVNVLDTKTQKFSHIQYSSIDNAIHSNYISAMLEDKRKNLWIVTSYGVDVLMKKTHQFVHYLHDDKDPYSIVNNNTNNIHEDSAGLIWVTTREGLSVFDPETGKFTNITKQDGLPDNTVSDIEEDNHHNMWASTPNGLSNITVTRSQAGLKFRFINFNENDGLQGREFTENSSLRTRDGFLLFGGSNGFNIFKPSDVRSSKSLPNLVFTGFEIFNESLNPGVQTNGRVILPHSITEAKSVSLKYNENSFSLDFAALNYFNPDKVQYQFKMDGFDPGWISVDNKIRKATYTNLDAGTYVFRVRNSDKDGWNGRQLMLNIVITPPFWKTIWAYLLYAAVIIAALLYIRREGIRKLRLQFALENEREEAQRMHELDLMKIRFFTNVSHEFRTPLSLIMAPVDKILKQVSEPDIQRQLHLVNRNARRLLNLVNQLLDFRRMEYQELKLHEKPGDIVRFIKELSYSFNDIGEQKHITFMFDSEADEFYTTFDHDKIERILFNLLSNAYKFTHQGGQVSVLLNVLAPDDRGSQRLEIKVIDTGIGIPADKMEKIFDPFFQNDVPGSMLNLGSGIGLSITREFVRLHRGRIFVESEFDQGSCFTVVLPLQQLDKSLFTDKPTTIDHDPAYIPADNQQKNGTPAAAGRDARKPTVLLVEDNDDFRFYIKDNLKDAFNIIEAENGKKGWQKALAMHPNLVVSDISMPEMNGIDLCMKLKNDNRTSHIPVILLTALIGEEQQLKGLETGASDYMTKPFNFEILLSKIKNILSQQEHMRKTYQKQVDVTPTEVQVDSPDELFIKKVLLLIDNNISNPNFSVEELSDDMFVSRYTLYKKILMMTGKTPNELVRSMRLKRAAQLLGTGHLTILQIGHKVGFKSQKYFVKAFKAEFNVIPSRYAEMAQGEKEN